jgi:hypothetical protein
MKSVALERLGGSIPWGAIFPQVPRHRQRGHSPGPGGRLCRGMQGAPPPRRMPSRSGRAHTCRVGRKVGELGTKRKYYSDHPAGGPPSQGGEIATRAVPLSLYLGPRLVNVVSLRKRPNSLYLQHKLSPLPPVLRQLLPLRHLQLTQQRLHSSYLLALHCCFLRHFC